MSLFTRVKAAKNALMGRIIEHSAPMGIMEYMRQFGKAPDISQIALVKKYWGWVYACAQLSANRFATTPLKLYASRAKDEPEVKNFRCRAVGPQKTKYLRARLGKSLQHVGGAEAFEELEEHPLLDLLQKFNDFENSFEAKELTCIMLDLTGNAYWYVERDGLGLPARMFVLRSHMVRILPDKKKFITGYLYGADALGGITAPGGEGRLEIPASEVIHFKYPNPLDPWYGMGPVQAAAYAIESNELREKFILATMGNMARPDLVVRYTEGELDAPERKAAEREWNAMFQGPNNAGKVKVTDYRWEMEKIGWNPSELKFNEGEQWILKKICSAFPVPEGLVNTESLSRAPRAGMEGSDLIMAQFNTLPRCTRFEEKLNERLCPMYDSRLFLAFDDPVPKDRKLQLDEDSQRLSSGYTFVNELRERDGLDPVPWGNEPNNKLQPPALDDSAGSEEGADGREPESNDQADDDLMTGATGRSGAGLFGNKKPKPDEEDEDEDEPKPEKPKPKKRPFGKALALKEALGDGLTIEVEGQYVHPSLAGIPVRIRRTVRNEAGRFSRQGPEDVRASRDVVEALR